MNIFIIISIILFLLCLFLLYDDYKQRKYVIEITNKYNDLFTLFENIKKYYHNMFKQMNRLDALGHYHIQDDFGIFFKYVRETLLKLKQYFN